MHERRVGGSGAGFLEYVSSRIWNNSTVSSTRHSPPPLPPLRVQIVNSILVSERSRSFIFVSCFFLFFFFSSSSTSRVFFCPDFNFRFRLPLISSASPSRFVEFPPAPRARKVSPIFSGNAWRSWRIYPIDPIRSRKCSTPCCTFPKFWIPDFPVFRM